VLINTVKETTRFRTLISRPTRSFTSKRRKFTATITAPVFVPDRETERRIHFRRLDSVVGSRRRRTSVSVRLCPTSICIWTGRARGFVEPSKPNFFFPFLLSERLQRVSAYNVSSGRGEISPRHGTDINFAEEDARTSYKPRTCNKNK